MQDHELKQLLQDFAAEPTASPIPDLAEKVQSRLTQRAKNRRIARALAAVLVIGIGAYFAIPKPAPIGGPNTVAELKVDQALEAEAQRHLALADRLMKLDPPRATHLPSSAGAMSLLAADRENFAGILLARADQLQKTPEKQANSKATYQQIVSQFPDTGQANIALKRLAEFKI